MQFTPPVQVVYALRQAIEEYFAETLERCNAIAYSRWDNAKTMMKAPPKSTGAVTPSVGKTSGVDVTTTPKQK